MSNQDILNTAPEGATHQATDGSNWKFEERWYEHTKMFVGGDKYEFKWLESEPAEVSLQSLVDIKLIADRDKRIAELESKIELLEKYNGSVDSLIDNIEAYNLEQQIKSIENLCGRLKRESYFHKETHDMAVIMISELNQAKELKGDL